jgi:hypothetical protein
MAMPLTIIDGWLIEKVVTRRTQQRRFILKDAQAVIYGLLQMMDFENNQNGKEKL